MMDEAKTRAETAQAHAREAERALKLAEKRLARASR